MSQNNLPAQVAPEFFALQKAVAGRYSLVRELGRGGMGIVFLARDVALDRPVAIKLLPPHFALTPEHRARFVREARTAARLTHPHIVPIHAVEETDGLVFFVMGFIEGDTLGSLVARDGPLPPTEVSRIAREVAWALGHAHANGVVHRDIKPDNILVERGSGRAVVTDFGIAQAVDSPETTAGRGAGTPRFMSPEQAAGDDVDGRSDLYALGAVAWFMATGRAPYESGSAAGLLVQHMTAPIPSLRAASPRMSPKLAAAIERCLAKAPADRFASADALARTLSDADDRSATPPSVRLFLERMRAADAEMGIVASGIVSAGFMFGVTMSGAEWATEIGRSLSALVAMVLFIGAIATFAGLGLIHLVQVLGDVKQLLRSGHAHASVAASLRDADDAPADSRSSAAATLLRIVTAVAAIWLARTGTDWLQVICVAGAIAVPTYALRQIWREKKIWARAMGGRFGRLLFRVAGIGMSDAPPASPFAGEPTVAALRSMTVDLFAALPEELRRLYPDFPALVQRLEADAVRQRLKGDPSDQGAMTAVAALETIRLDLLRMHAASVGTGVTEDVEAVRRLGDEISARLRATDEMSELLRGR